jgi:hypothetical protein
MQRFIDQTSSALCYELGRREWPQDDGPGRAPYNDLDRFVQRQFGNMPRFLCLGMKMATLLFGLWGLGRGAAFHRLPPARQRAQVESWRASRLGPFRDFIKFYESLCLIALYSRRDEPLEERFLA